MVAPGVDHNEGIFVVQSACEWAERGSVEKERGERRRGEVFIIIKRGITETHLVSMRQTGCLFGRGSARPLRSAPTLRCLGGRCYDTMENESGRKLKSQV